jgi:hypothetical protein
MKFSEIPTILQKRGVSPSDKAVLCGSTPIASRVTNFREIGDIDLVISPHTFLSLAVSHKWHVVFPQKGHSWKELSVKSSDCEAFLFWRIGTRYIPWKKIQKDCTLCNGLRLADIAWVKRYKRALHREKDMRDLGILKMQHV